MEFGDGVQKPRNPNKASEKYRSRPLGSTEQPYIRTSKIPSEVQSSAQHRSRCKPKYKALEKSPSQKAHGHNSLYPSKMLKKPPEEPL